MRPAVSLPLMNSRPEETGAAHGAWRYTGPVTSQT